MPELGDKVSGMPAAYGVPPDWTYARCIAYLVYKARLIHTELLRQGKVMDTSNEAQLVSLAGLVGQQGKTLDADSKRALKGALGAAAAALDSP